MILVTGWLMESWQKSAVSDMTLDETFADRIRTQGFVNVVIRPSLFLAVFWVASLVSLILFARPDASLIVIAFTVVFGLFAGFGITVSHALWGRRLVLSEDGVTLTGYRSVPAIHASWDEVATIEVQSQKGDTRVIAFRLANKQSRRRTDYLFCARCTPQVCKEFLSFTSKLGGENTETGDNNKVTS